MVKYLKILGITLSVVIGIVILAVACVNLIPGNYYKGLISSVVKSTTGRDLVIQGNLEINLSSALAFKASQITFANAPWGTFPHMATVQRINGEIGLIPLARKVLDVTLEIDRPTLFFEINHAGQANWRFGRPTNETVEPGQGAETKEERKGRPLQPLIREIKITQANVAYVDARSGKHIRFNSDQIFAGIDANGLTIDAAGQLDAIPVKVSGRIQPLHKEHRDHADVRLNGHFGDVKMVVRGTADPILPTARANIRVHLETPSLAAFSALAYRDLPDIGPFVADTRLIADQGKYTLDDLHLTLHHETLTAAIQGTIADLSGLSGIHLNVKADTDDLTRILKNCGYPLPYRLPDSLKIDVTAAGSVEQLALEKGQASLYGQGLKAQAAVSAQNIMALEGIHATIFLESESQDLFTQLTQAKLPPLVPFKSEIRFNSKSPSIAQSNIDIKVDANVFHAKLVGVVENLLKLKGVDTRVDLRSDSLAWLSDYSETELPPLQNLKASAHIVSSGNTVAVKNIQAHLTGSNMKAEATGVIHDLSKGLRFDSKVNLSLQSVDFLTKYLRTDLDPLNSLKATAGISYDGRRYELKNLTADISGKGVKAKIDGSMGDLIKLKPVDAVIDVDLESLALLSKLTKTTLPQTGPLRTTAHIVRQEENWELEAVTIDLFGEKMQATVTGAITDLAKLAGIQADIDLSADSLAALDHLVKRKLPVSEPVALKGRFTAERDLHAPVDIQVELKSPGVTANLRGRVAEPLQGKGMDMVLTVTGESLEKIGKLAGFNSDRQEALTLRAEIAASEKTRKQAELRLRIGRCDLHGHIAIDQPSELGGRPYLTGKLDISELDLSQYPKKKRESAENTVAATGDQDKPEKIKTGQEKVFSSKPLPLGVLNWVDADLALKIENLKTRQLDLRDLDAHLTLNDGRLHLKPMKAHVGQGFFDGVITLDTQNKPASFAVAIEMNDATFRNFGGKINFLADLDGRGDSVAAIMAGLDGLFKFEVRDATLKRSFMTEFGTGILDSLNPFDKDKETTELICAIIFFNIRDGRADAKRKIAAQMTDVTWFGSGEIDLKTEKINFAMHPISRKSLDVSLGDLAKLVYVGGTLANPKIYLDPTDVAVTFGKVAAAVVTGGITFAVEFLWGKIKANRDVCGNILKKIEKNLAEDRDQPPRD